VAASLTAVATLYAGVGAVTRSRVTDNDADFGLSIQEATRNFENASHEISQALDLLAQNVRFIRAHWDEEYERRLRESGFRGSMFLLQEWRIHLDTMKLFLGQLLLGYKETSEAGASRGWTDVRRAAEEDDPVLGSTMRPLCQALVRFTEFEEEEAARTAVVFNEYTRMLG